MIIFDEFLQQDIEVQEEITPEIGKEMKIYDPAEFDEIIGKEEQ